MESQYLGDQGISGQCLSTAGGSEDKSCEPGDIARLQPSVLYEQMLRDKPTPTFCDMGGGRGREGESSC